MNRILILLLMLFSSLNFANNTLLERQFANKEISESLKSQVPHLQQTQSEGNQYTLKFVPNTQNFEYFARVSGRNIFQARFVVSWYVFTDGNSLPKSIDKIMTTVNTKKPYRFVSLTSINGKWESFVELPYNKILREDAHVVAYISYPNANGVLVPIAGQVFHKMKEKTVDMNGDMLSYWNNKGYF